MQNTKWNIWSGEGCEIPQFEHLLWQPCLLEITIFKTCGMSWTPRVPWRDDGVRHHCHVTARMTDNRTGPFSKANRSLLRNSSPIPRIFSHFWQPKAGNSYFRVAPVQWGSVSGSGCRATQRSRLVVGRSHRALRLVARRAHMQQNGSSGSNSSDGSGRERLALAFSPLPAATTRVRRFIQERRSLPLPRVMVVFSATGDTEKANDADAMSSTDRAEDDLRKPSSPPAGSGVRKPLLPSLDVQEQEVEADPLFTHFTHKLARSVLEKKKD